jgi:hypothetical protein
MQATAEAASVSRKSVWAGRILSGLVVLVFAFTAALGMLNPTAAAQGFAHYGYPPASMVPIAVVNWVCVLLYAIPRTSVLGAILLTGYLGGAISTHVRAGEPFYLPLGIGVIVWLGLFLRDARLRALLPLRSPASQ